MEVWAAVVAPLARSTALPQARDVLYSFLFSFTQDIFEGICPPTNRERSGQFLGAGSKPFFVKVIVAHVLMRHLISDELKIVQNAGDSSKCVVGFGFF